MKNRLRILLTAALCLPVFLYVYPVSDAGILGNGIEWTLSDGLLVIEGPGEIPDFREDKLPFVRTDIKKIVVKDGITRVGDRVFMNCQSVTLISIPASVTALGKKVVSGCSNLTSFVVLNSTPPATDSLAARFEYGQIVLYVPAGTENIYKNTDIWNRFYNRGVAITEVKINDGVDAVHMTPSTSRTFTATLFPESAGQGKAITWSSSDTVIASVDGNGVVTGKQVAIGKTVITAVTVNPAIYATCTVSLNNGTLKSLSVNGISLSPADVQFEYSLAESLPYSNTSVTISAEAEYPDVYDVVGTGQRSINVGNNVLTFSLVSKDGTVIRNYTVNVKRQSNTGITLRNISVYDAMPVSAEGDVYTYIVPYITTDIRIDVESDSHLSTVTGDGQQSNLRVGENNFTVRIAAEDTEYWEEYTVKVIRKSNSTRLADFSVNGETCLPGKEFYTCVVPYAVIGATVSVVPDHAGATVTGVGTMHNLRVGENIFTVRVTAEDTLYTEEYQVKIIRKNNSTALRALSVGDKMLSVGAAIGEYSVVVNDVSVGIQIEAEAQDTNAVVSGTGRKMVFSPGDNIFTVRVTAEDTLYTKDYKINIRWLSSDVAMGVLTAGKDTLSVGPAGDYRVNVSNATDSILIRAVAHDPNAVAYGAGIYPLPVGDTVIIVGVIAEDITCRRDYAINVRRFDNDVAMGVLTAGKDTLSVGPAGYSVNVSNATDSILIRAAAHDPNAVAYGAGIYPLPVGDTVIIVGVIAEDTTCRRDYAINVRRFDNDATLRRLAVNPGNLAPAFDPAVTEYTFEESCSSLVEYVLITAEANHADARVFFVDRQPLAFGENSFDITVIAEDSSCRQVYTVNVTRRAWDILPDGVLTVCSDVAMSGCNDLSIVSPWQSQSNDITRVVLEDGVTRIGAESFFNYSNLTSVTLSGSITCIGDLAFFGCSKLTSVINLSPEPQPINSTVFFDCKISDIMLFVPVVVLKKYQAADVWKDFKISLMVPVTEIGLDNLSVNMVVGKTETLVATVLPRNATIKDVIWSSSDIAIVTVSPDGVISAESEGIAVVTATTADGGFSVSCIVTVWKSAGIAPVETLPAIQVCLDGRTLYVNSPVAERVYVYSVTGTLLGSFDKKGSPTGSAISLTGFGSAGSPTGRILIVKGSSGWSRKIVVND